MNRKATAFKGSVLAILLLGLAVWVDAGSLTPPPGPVTPTMKTLHEVEPRTPISSLPFTISQPGSYYVTANLTGTSGSNGITIAASQVSLDLRGFALQGVVGSLNGILVSGLQQNVSVLNGAVNGWGQFGINLTNATQALLDGTTTDDNEGTGTATGEDTDVKGGKAHNNAGDGIALGDECKAQGCESGDNGGDGIKCGSKSKVECCRSNGNTGSGVDVGTGSLVKDCTTSENGSDGCTVGDGSTVVNCTSRNNTGNGIAVTTTSTSEGATITNCTTVANGANGIIGGNGSTILGCTSTGNSMDGIVGVTGCTISQCTARRNTQDGIEVVTDCRATDNTCHSNGLLTGDGAGIHVSTGGNNCRLESNNVTDNDRGIDVDSAGNLIIRNSASGNTTNYAINGGNTVGLILSVVGDPAFNNANCWANLIY